MTVSAASFTTGIQAAATSATTASKTWVLGRLYKLVTIGYDPGGGAVIPTVAGMTEVAHQLSVNGLIMSAEFRFLGDGSVGTKTISFGATSQSQIQWTVDEVQGTDTGGTNAANSIVQAVTGNNTTNTLTVTLAAFGSVNNATWGWGWNQGGTPMTSKAGYTDLSTQASFFVLKSEFIATNDTTPNMTENGVATDSWIFYGVELKAAGGGGGATSLPAFSPRPRFTTPRRRYV